MKKQPEITPDKFKEWRLKVLAVMKENGLADNAINETDWDAWKDEYFDSGLSPQQSFKLQKKREQKNDKRKNEG
jgi:hypothetical protein